MPPHHGGPTAWPTTLNMVCGLHQGELNSVSSKGLRSGVLIQMAVMGTSEQIIGYINIRPKIFLKISSGGLQGKICKI